MTRAHWRGLTVAAAVALVLIASLPGARAAARAVDAPAQGIDVADHQDEAGPIDWATVAGQYQFAYIKATEGNYYVNSYYAHDLTAALHAGLDAGAYAFATPSDADGATEARYFLRRAGYTGKRTLLTPMVDLESDPYQPTPCWGLAPADMISWISSYSQTIFTALGVRPIIYTQATWWNLCTGGSGAFDDSNLLWVGSDGSASTQTPAGFTSWAIWQAIDETAAGVTGPVDTDRFNGTPADLEAQLSHRFPASPRPNQSLPH